MTKQMPQQAQDDKCPYSPHLSLFTPLDGMNNTKLNNLFTKMNKNSCSLFLPVKKKDFLKENMKC